VRNDWIVLGLTKLWFLRSCVRQKVCSGVS